MITKKVIKIVAYRYPQLYGLAVVVIIQRRDIRTGYKSNRVHFVTSCDRMKVVAAYANAHAVNYYLMPFGWIVTLQKPGGKS